MPVVTLFTHAGTLDPSGVHRRAAISEGNLAGRVCRVAPQTAQRGNQESDVGVGPQCLQCGHAVSCGQTEGAANGRLALAVPLRGPEEEQLVFLNWPTKREAKSVVNVHGASHSGELVLSRDSGHRRVPMDLPGGSVEFVGAALIDNVGHRPAAAPEFCSVRVG